MTWDSGRPADWRHSDQEGSEGTLKTVRKRETSEEMADRLGYVPHEEALKETIRWTH